MNALKKTELQKLDTQALGKLAFSLGIKRPTLNRKADLISEILAAQKVKRLSTVRKVAARRKPTAAAAASPTIPARRTTRKKTPPSTATTAPTTRKSKTTRVPAPAAPMAPPPPSGQIEHRFETPAHPQPTHFGSPYDDLGELPEAYGTGRLFFAARDPHWIYSYWDYTWQQLEDMRRAARHGELKLRIRRGRDSQAPIVQEVTLNPASRNWFVQVDQADCDYCAEFGFHPHHGDFVVASRSQHTHTPPDRMSDNTEARFVTIPFHLSFRELYAMIRAYFRDGEELADVLWRLQMSGFKFPFDYERMGPVDEDLLSKMFGSDLCRRIQLGSEVLTEWLRHRIAEETSSGIFSASSPFGSSFGASSSRSFWFNVNAELIIYGATDPAAQVTFDGKDISLKQDGTFRFQFALPDGNYNLPVSATSSDEVETRAVNLHFVRDTKREGDVGDVQHPKDLPPPNPNRKQG